MALHEKWAERRESGMQEPAIVSWEEETEEELFLRKGMITQFF